MRIETNKPRFLVQGETVEVVPLSQTGASAYEVAVKNGFSGSQEDWLESLAGSDVSMFKSLVRNPDSIIVGSVTRDTNGAATSAAVVWPDGSAGTYTALVLSTSFLGAVDSYRITYGSPVTKTYTQPSVTRDSDGAVISVPAIVVT